MALILQCMLGLISMSLIIPAVFGFVAATDAGVAFGIILCFIAFYTGIFHAWLFAVRTSTTMKIWAIKLNLLVIFILGILPFLKLFELDWDF